MSGVVGEEEVVAVVLFDGSEFVEVSEKVEDGVPRLVVVENDSGFAGEVFVESLIADEDGDGFKDILKGGSGGEDEGVGFDDFLLDITEANFFVAVRVFDVPTGVKEVVKELGTEGAMRVIGAGDGSGKAKGGHN